MTDARGAACSHRKAGGKKAKGKHREAPLLVRPYLAGQHLPISAKDLDSPREWVYVGDAARALTILGEAPPELAEGKRFLLTGYSRLTWRAWLALWAEKAGLNPALRPPG